jgi:hypothetical protein
MPIRMTDGPEGGHKIIADAIAPLFQGGKGAAGKMAKVAEGGGLAVNSAAPHPVFVVGLTDVAQGRLLGAARQETWRYLLLRGPRAVGSVTLRRLPDTEELVFSHVTRGRYVDSTVQAIDAAERAPQVAGAEYELRLLDVPALQLRAIWLHGEGADLLVPLAPAPGPLESNRVCSEDEVLAAVQDRAIRILDQPRDAGG